MEKEKKKPESIVLEVQSLRHVTSTTLNNERQEAKDGKKHT